MKKTYLTPAEKWKNRSSAIESQLREQYAVAREMFNLTLRERWPLASNRYQHAALLRGLNTLAQQGKLDMWAMGISNHNASLKIPLYPEKQ